MDKISIKGLKIYAYHGVKKEEKENGQNFFIDCDMFLDRNEVRFKDDIESTISYSKAAKLIKKIMQSKSWDLIETATENVAYFLFKEFEKLLAVEITLKKPDAPIKNIEFDYMAITIRRERGDFV